MPNPSKEFWKKYGYVISSKNRRLILETIENPSTPLELANKTKLGMNLTSRALRELTKENITMCMNPEAKVGRLYSLTNLGKEIIRHMKKSEAKY